MTDRDADIKITGQAPQATLEEEAFLFLLTLRRTLSQARLASHRSDQHSPCVGKWWGIVEGLQRAYDAALSEFGPKEDEQ